MSWSSIALLTATAGAQPLARPPIFAASGELDFEVLHADDEPIVQLARSTTIAEARAFFESPEVVAIRKRAGAEPPTFFYLVADPRPPHRIRVIVMETCRSTAI